MRTLALMTLLLVADDALAQRPTAEPFKAGRSVTVANNGIVATPSRRRSASTC